MATWRPCGKSNPNEAEAIEALREAFDDEWTLLTSIPRYSAGREIDALLLGLRGIVVLELKYHSGTIVVPFTGAWTGFNDDKKETPLEQAEVASQILKSTLIREDPDLKKVWVDYVVIMTNPNCHLQVHERLKSQHLVGLLPDAVPLVEGRLAQRSSRRVSSESLESIFKIITGDPPPADIASLWQSPTVRPNAEQRGERVTYDVPSGRATPDRNDFIEGNVNAPEASEGRRYRIDDSAGVNSASYAKPQASISVSPADVFYTRDHRDSTISRAVVAAIIAGLLLVLVVVFIGTQFRFGDQMAHTGTEIARLSQGDLLVTVNGPKNVSANQPLIATGRYKGNAAFLIQLDGATPPSSVQLRTMRLDPFSSVPEVVISYYLGGAHCCTATKIATMDMYGGWHVIDAGSLDGDGGFTFVDLEGDHSYELTYLDNSFLYAFGCYACSYAPMRIKKLVGFHLEDVTRDPKYGSFLREQLARMEQRGRGNGALQTNGYLGGWVAAKAEVGEFDDAWRTMLATYDHNSGWDMEDCETGEPLNQCPSASKRRLDFPSALSKHLVKTGYISAEQTARLPSLSISVNSSANPQASSAASPPVVPPADSLVPANAGNTSPDALAIRVRTAMESCDNDAAKRSAAAYLLIVPLAANQPKIASLSPIGTAGEITLISSRDILDGIRNNVFQLYRGQITLRLLNPTNSNMTTSAVSGITRIAFSPAAFDGSFRLSLQTMISPNNADWSRESFSVPASGTCYWLGALVPN